MAQAKPRKGRALKKAADKRDTVFTLKLTATERRQLEREAKARGVPASQVMRTALHDEIQRTSREIVFHDDEYEVDDI